MSSRAVLLLTTVAAALVMASGIAFAATNENQLAAPGQGDNLLTHGNFEVPHAGARFVTYSAGETFGGWTVKSGSVDHIGGYWQAARDRQSVDLNGGPDHAGSVSQDISTIPGRSYKLRFAMAGNPELIPNIGCFPGVKKMAINWSGEKIATVSFDSSGHSRTNMGWIYHGYLVTADSAVTRLKFRSLTLTGACGPALDDVSVRKR
jgi:choice-of-anchor C domain-containing protein